MLYRVELLSEDDWTRSEKNGNEIGGVSFVLKFHRLYSSIMLHTYLPSILLCICSVLSVYVPSDLVPGRMGLCITAFLSIISLFNGARRDWPQTAYMKAIDPWTVCCYLTSFLALAEYCIVLYLTSRSDWEMKVVTYKKQNAPHPGRLRQRFAKIGPAEREKIIDENGEEIRRGEMLAMRVEFVSRILMPVYFLLFNIIYWCVVLS